MSSSNLKPIKLYSHATGPNPWKVAIILEELNVPYETEFMDMAVLHKPEFEKINVNGRVPAIHDPNTDFTLWESGAIIEYLVDTYDKSNTLTVSGLDSYKVKQWLHFQMSGQGPYYGQMAWFYKFHSEQVQSAKDRYRDQTLRVLHVINMHLEKSGQEYLVGNKVTYADLAFVTWDMMIEWIVGDEAQSLDIHGKYPLWSKWNKSLLARDSVKKIMSDKNAAMAAH